MKIKDGLESNSVDLIHCWLVVYITVLHAGYLSIIVFYLFVMYVFTNEEDMITNLSYLPPLGNSDHIYIQFDLVCYSEPKRMDNFKNNTIAANIDLMKHILDVDWVSLLNLLDINDSWLQFKFIFQGIGTLDHCVPILTSPCKEKKSLYSNSEVFCLKMKKNHL